MSARRSLFQVSRAWVFIRGRLWISLMNFRRITGRVSSQPAEGERRLKMSTGRFINPDSLEYFDEKVETRWLFFSVPIFQWEVRDGKTEPIFVRPNGDYIKMVTTSGNTDFCSTPPPMWKLPYMEPWIYALQGTIHDNLYQHHACLKSVDSGATWSICELSRADSDSILCEMIEADPENPSKIAAHEYWLGVRIGGRGPWDSGGDKPASGLDRGKPLPILGS